MDKSGRKAGDYSHIHGDFESSNTVPAARFRDFRLRAGSPFIDAADGDLSPPTDFDGNPRVDVPGVDNGGSGTPPYADLGAFEYQP